MTQHTLSFWDSVPTIPKEVIIPQRPASFYSVVEYGLIPIRQQLAKVSSVSLDNPEAAAEYCRDFINTSPFYRPTVENLMAIFLNTRRRAIGHCIIGQGTLDTLLVHPREVFQNALTICASAIVLMHNHPSGDPTPSDADIRVTRDLIRGGQFLKIDVLDHVVLGQTGVCQSNPRYYQSLRELGHFYC
ncbi:MAG TPA: JAB domain-containing protein [Verrucomicrobiae bacterium]